MTRGWDNLHFKLHAVEDIYEDLAGPFHSFFVGWIRRDAGLADEILNHFNWIKHVESSN
jgi:hypothetical protein